ncbi:MAG: rod shape-determining protein MreD [Gaiellales bacterium]
MSAADTTGFDAFDDDLLLDDEDTGEVPRPARASPWGPIVLVLALLLAIYLEIALAIDARVLGAVPDLALIVIVAVALRHGAIWGAVAGFVAGVLIDIAVQSPPGASSLVLTPVGWLAGAWSERRRHISLGMALIVLLVATVVTIIGDAIITIAIESQNIAWGIFAVHAVAELAFTLLFGIIILALLRRIAGVAERTRA